MKKFVGQKLTFRYRERSTLLLLLKQTQKIPQFETKSDNSGGEFFITPHHLLNLNNFVHTHADTAYTHASDLENSLPSGHNNI